MSDSITTAFRMGFDEAIAQRKDEVLEEREACAQLVCKMSANPNSVLAAAIRARSAEAAPEPVGTNLDSRWENNTWDSMKPDHDEPTRVFDTGKLSALAEEYKTCRFCKGSTAKDKWNKLTLSCVICVPIGGWPKTDKPAEKPNFTGYDAIDQSSSTRYSVSNEAGFNKKGFVAFRKQHPGKPPQPEIPVYLL